MKGPIINKTELPSPIIAASILPRLILDFHIFQPFRTFRKYVKYVRSVKERRSMNCYN